MLENCKNKGIFVALLTPFDKNDQIDAAGLKKLIDMNIRKGVSGFFGGGTTAEAFLMSNDERKDLLEKTVEIVDGRATLYAHVGAISTEQSIDMAKHAARSGADAVAAVPPFYHKFTFEEIKTHFYRIADSMDKPLFIYNFPNFTGVTLTKEQLIELLDHENIVGIKHTCSDYYAAERLKKAHPDKLVYNGFDEMLVSGLAIGLDGAVGSTYNFMAEKFVKLYDLCMEGKYPEALKIQQEANGLINVVAELGLISSMREILRMLGIEVGKSRGPFLPLKPEGIERLKKEVMPFVQA